VRGLGVLFLHGLYSLIFERSLCTTSSYRFTSTAACLLASGSSGSSSSLDIRSSNKSSIAASGLVIPSGLNCFSIAGSLPGSARYSFTFIPSGIPSDMWRWLVDNLLSITFKGHDRSLSTGAVLYIVLYQTKMNEDLVNLDQETDCSLRAPSHQHNDVRRGPCLRSAAYPPYKPPGYGAHSNQMT
jgi:hypothetical protein